MDSGIKVMNEVYASPVGMTVLQLKDVPPRPAAFDGRVMLRLADGVTADILKDALSPYGAPKCELLSGFEMTRVYFSDHMLAERFLAAVSQIHVLEGTVAFLEYNDRPYDERGWCACRAPP